jgi:GTP-binding protein EngB required for normal cell division
MDQNLNIARDFLLEEIDSVVSGSTSPTPEQSNFAGIATKIIMMLGILRSNVEDYLIILTVIDKLQDVDLSDEIKLISSYYGFEQEPSHEIEQHPSEDKSSGELDNSVKGFKIGKQNLLTSISI